MEDDLDYVDACMDSLGMCLNITDPEGSLRSSPPKLPSLEFYLESWEEIRKDYRKLSDAIKALREDKEKDG
jgi:hypothetical protein